MRSRIVLVMLLVPVLGACTGDAGTSDSTLPSPSPTATGLLAQVRDRYSSDASLTLDACAVGAQCGRLERVDDNNVRCTYQLTLQSVDETEKTLTFLSGWGHGPAGRGSMSCSYSPWANAKLIVTVLGPDNISIAPEGFEPGGPSLELNFLPNAQ